METKQNEQELIDDESDKTMNDKMDNDCDENI